MSLRRIARIIVAWWAERPTQRRAARLKARRSELIARIRVEGSRHRKVRPLFDQLRDATNELLRLEQRRVQ